jgi:hypothetical protein
MCAAAWFLKVTNSLVTKVELKAAATEAGVIIPDGTNRNLRALMRKLLFLSVFLYYI